ncbi:small glutamine-rich tetratricopeptide repeat-containing protein beta [Ditylenchus destructor]|uniref:Small glutamine-rich tetratricopeptide repeat-containing protein beta n=1 Tax=Ditylenchus destructor TaxID=166010 RepID=A0AAD4R7Q2_9BILA|nr:small glutamine-rich tetratricopeptide repeat-containing protein beta [Ditylenchus destructor]
MAPLCNCQSPHKKADQLRDEGKSFFIQHNYKKAVSRYTASLEIVKCPLTYCFRAQSYIYLKRYHNALVDADEALLLDENSIKAQFRKAMALKGLDRKEQALDILEKCHNLQPNNEEINKEFTKLHKQLRPMPLLEIDFECCNNAHQQTPEKKFIPGAKIAKLQIIQSPAVWTDTSFVVVVTFVDRSETITLDSLEEARRAFVSYSQKIEETELFAITIRPDVIAFLKSVKKVCWSGSMLHLVNVEFESESIFADFFNETVHPLGIVFEDIDRIHFNLTQALNKLNDGFRYSIRGIGVFVLGFLFAKYEQSCSKKIDTEQLVEMMHRPPNDMTANMSRQFRSKKVKPNGKIHNFVLDVCSSYLDVSVEDFIEMFVNRFPQRVDCSSPKVCYRARIILTEETRIILNIEVYENAYEILKVYQDMDEEYTAIIIHRHPQDSTVVSAETSSPSSSNMHRFIKH